jgi:hypothetical protein
LQVVHDSSAAERSIDNINGLARASKTIVVPDQEPSTNAASVEASAFSREPEVANSVNGVDELAGVSSASAEPKQCLTHGPNPVWSDIASVKPIVSHHMAFGPVQEVANKMSDVDHCFKPGKETLPSPEDHARSSRGGKRVRFAIPTEIQLEDEGLIDDAQPAVSGHVVLDLSDIVVNCRPE